jgi:hypothetical protein
MHWNFFFFFLGAAVSLGIGGIFYVLQKADNDRMLRLLEQIYATNPHQVEEAAHVLELEIEPVEPPRFKIKDHGGGHLEILHNDAPQPFISEDILGHRSSNE